MQYDDPPQPRSVDKLVPRDIETICLKCMRKNPGQRYTSARELADDLRRFLAGEPIVARRMSTTARGLRWVSDPGNRKCPRVDPLGGNHGHRRSVWVGAAM
jgi:hypothetical protein